MKYRVFPISAVTAAVILLCGSCSSRPEYPFRDTSLPIEERVNDLVGRLTLEEKVAQMSSAAPAIERLGIPAYDWQNECLHGVGKIADYKVTVFPQPIGLAATWDEEGMLKVADCIAEEGRAIYHEALRNDNHASYYGLTYWAPNINIFRDPRWGRGHETFGEDPYLTGILGCAYVRGLQGDDPRYLKASACAKHYAVHSGPESKRHEFNAEVSDDDLWNTYLPAFRDVVEKADVSGIMCAYNAVDGRPCCGNDLLMMGILRDDWGFKGYVTSDCGAIDDFYKGHHTHPDTISAAADAVVHGTDLDCIRDNTFKTLVEAVRTGEMEESDIDRAVKRLFTIRFRLGMFDPDEEVKYASVPLSALDSKEHRELALSMARESMVLLKNEGGLLPLDKNIRKIAVVGPNAAQRKPMLGNYYGYPSELPTIVEAIKSHVSPSTEVVYEQLTDYFAPVDFVPLDMTEVCSIDGKKGFKAEYFADSGFSCDPVVKYVERPELSYMGKTIIADSISSLDFGVRYNTMFTPAESGEYTLDLDTWKRFRFSIDGDVIIDAMDRKGKTDGRHAAYFDAGKPYMITIEAQMKGRDGDLTFDIGRKVVPDLKELASRVADADVIIFAGGISPSLEGEQNGVKCEGFEDGDRTTIQLPKAQTRMMRQLAATGKPVVFVMLTGSAIASVWEEENLPAIVNAWYGGQAGAVALADVLFGDYNPGGRLPITFYGSDRDLPPFTDYAMDGRTYRYFKGKPLYPFGYGLSYTTFGYDNLTLDGPMTTSSEITVKADVENLGKVPGDEVVQLYVSRDGKDEPIRSLKGFKRIHLNPGERKTVSFTLTPEDLAIYRLGEGRSVNPGKFNVTVGGGQPGTKAPVISSSVILKGEKYTVSK